MTRFGAVFWLVLVLAAVFTTFKVKYAVQNLEDELNRVRKQTIAERQEIRVLTAEWTYLNQPERLAELNRRFLALAPIAASQLQHSVTDIPLRAPAASPDVLAEANPDLAALQTPTGRVPITPAVLGPAPAIRGRTAVADRPEDAARLQLAKAGPINTLGNALGNKPGSLDALIAQIADAR